jgi:hypothetical protein
MYDNPYFLAVFSAGNWGDLGLGTIANPGQSKNCLTVGSSLTMNTQAVASFSSRGPTIDGRYGVDVIAPGTSITSAAASGTTSRTCGTTVKSGTSMATPMAAGAAALVRQYFMDTRFYASNCNAEYSFCRSFNPLASTVKAVLINSAVGASTVDGTTIQLSRAPDVYQGFGSIVLKNVLPLADKSIAVDLFIEEFDATEGNNYIKFVTVKSANMPLRCTIAWTDKPGLVGSTKQLLNDINLKIISSSGEIYYGNNNINSDSVNPVERIVIKHPTVSTYKVIVSVATGALTNSQSQKVSLVISGDNHVKNG